MPSKRPLEGVRIADLTAMWAGPYATMLLADLGAEVVKVESPKAWDNIRTLLPPPMSPGEEWWNTAHYFHEYNRNKKSVSLDLRHENARPVFHDLVRSVDGVYSNLRGDQPKKLGLLYEQLKEVNLRIVCCSLSGFGQ